MDAMNDQVRNEFMEAAGNLNAEFVSLRYESQRTNIVEINREGELRVSSKFIEGGIVETFKSGGWGRLVFTGPPVTLVPRMVESCRMAFSMAKEHGSLSFESPAVGSFFYAGLDHPDRTTLEDKAALVRESWDILRSTGEVTECSVLYRDVWTRRHYLTSDGTDLYTEDPYTYLVPEVWAAGDGTHGFARENIGGRGGRGALSTFRETLSGVAARAVRQAGAGSVPSGMARVVLDPKLTGLLLHEALGHMLEADYLQSNMNLAELMKKGRRIAPACFTAVDDATIPEAHGTCLFDDEGVPGSRTILVEGGKIVARLHNRTTAGIFGEKSTGNSRALNFFHHPQVRMSNTFVEPGEGTLDDLLAELGDGYYLKGTGSGETGMENFTFRSAEAFAVRGGRVCEPLKAMSITGNIFTTLQSIAAVAGDLRLFTGFCGKNGQIPLPVSFGGPSLLLGPVVVA